MMTKRQKVDWEAIERDFRTGKFTLRELEAKHGIGYAQISRHSTKEGWTKDLRGVIREATAAAVIRETVHIAVTIHAKDGQRVRLGVRAGEDVQIYRPPRPAR